MSFPKNFRLVQKIVVQESTTSFYWRLVDSQTNNILLEVTHSDPAQARADFRTQLIALGATPDQADGLMKV